MPEIRPYEADDVEAAVPLFRELLPGNVHTAPAIRHWVESMPARAGFRAWVAVHEGEVVGWANARLRWDLDAEGVGGSWVGVLPASRRRGVGSALARLAEDHATALGAHELRSFVRKDDRTSRDFARNRGFREGRGDQEWELDLREARLRDRPPPPGVEVVALRDVVDRQRELFELYDAAHGDMPGDHSYALRFEEWLPEALGDPTLDLDLSAVVLANGAPVSFAWVNSDREGGVGVNEMTGTHPAHRRRGFARLAKETSIRWAVEAGLRTLFTGNDEANADMLALNEHLGYRPTHVILDVTKTL